MTLTELTYPHAHIPHTTQEYHVCHVKQAIQRAEKEWPPKLHGPFCAQAQHPSSTEYPSFSAPGVPTTEQSLPAAAAEPAASPLPSPRQQQQQQQAKRVGALPQIVSAVKAANARIAEVGFDM